MGKSCISETEYCPRPQERIVPNEPAQQIPSPTTARHVQNIDELAKMVAETVKSSMPASHLVNRNELNILDVIRAIQHFDIEDIVRLHVAVGQRLNEYLLKMKAADRILK